MGRRCLQLPMIKQRGCDNGRVMSVVCSAEGVSVLIGSDEIQRGCGTPPAANPEIPNFHDYILA